MRKKLLFSFAACFLAVSVLCLQPLRAQITNAGDQTVQVDIEKESGSSQRHTLAPSQEIEIPEDAVQIKVLPPRTSYGDEGIKVTIKPAGGTSKTIEDTGGVYTLGAESPLMLEQGKVTNSSNTRVLLTATEKSGKIKTIDLPVSQSATISKDVVEVGIHESSVVFGDEQFEVSVLLATGKTGTLKKVGEVVKAAEDRSKTKSKATDADESATEPVGSRVLVAPPPPKPETAGAKKTAAAAIAAKTEKKTEN